MCHIESKTAAELKVKSKGNRTTSIRREKIEARSRDSALELMNSRSRLKTQAKKQLKPSYSQ